MLNVSSSTHTDARLAVHRLRGLADLADADVAAIEMAAADSRFVSAGEEIAREGHEPMGHSILLTGWIAYVRILADGCRQITGFALPGETFGNFRSRQSTAQTSLVALEGSTYCFAPQAEPGSPLDQAYEISGIEQHARAIDNITRLGRMNARERIYDLLLELIERLKMSGISDANGFAIPLTQECFADALGLTPVHVNRTLQICRASGDLSWSAKKVQIQDIANLARRLGRRPLREAQPAMRRAYAVN